VVCAGFCSHSVRHTALAGSGLTKPVHKPEGGTGCPAGGCTKENEWAWPDPWMHACRIRSHRIETGKLSSGWTVGPTTLLCKAALPLIARVLNQNHCSLTKNSGTPPAGFIGVTKTCFWSQDSVDPKSLQGDCQIPGSDLNYDPGRAKLDLLRLPSEWAVASNLWEVQSPSIGFCHTQIIYAERIFNGY